MCHQIVPQYAQHEAAAGLTPQPLCPALCIQHSQTQGCCLAVCCPKQLSSAGLSLEDVLERGEREKGPSQLQKSLHKEEYKHAAAHVGAAI